MSIVGIFTKAQPSINELVFDAVLSEASELPTQVTKFPIETGAVGNDHVVQMPLKIILTVGVSDNIFRKLATDAGGLSSLASAGISVATGKVVSALGRAVVAAGLAGSIVNAAFAAGSANTRSQTMLEKIRDLQRNSAIVNVVGAKREYQNCVIVNTRQETTHENEAGLELIIELQQMLIVNSRVEKIEIPAPNDTAELQAQNITNIGQVTLQ